MPELRSQLRNLYGFEFPDELFELWEWHQSLSKAAVAGWDVLAMRPSGVLDALAGKLDGVLRYPVVLHWRYQYDLPELFTLFVGDTDGLHWGYWFDDPGKLPPVIASYYARDAVDYVASPSLWHAIATRSEAMRESIVENRTHDPKHATSYTQQLAALDELDAVLRKPPAVTPRTPIAKTPEGMGIVVERAQLGRWIEPDEIVREEILQFVDDELAAGRPGTALLVGRQLWDGHKTLSLEIFVRAYPALGRDALHAVALAHQKHPAIPSLDLTSYQLGDYSDVPDALAHPLDVIRLTLRSALPLETDLSALANLRELDVAAARMTELPASLAACTKLERAHLYNNQLVAFPAALAGLPALRTVSLGRNPKLTSLAGLERCAALEHLDLGHCPLVRLPDDLSGWPKLAKLDVGGTNLTQVDHDHLRATMPDLAITGKPVGTGSMKTYSAKATFAVGDSIAHPTFGTGTVVRVGDGKLDVSFVDGTKTLVHAKK